MNALLRRHADTGLAAIVVLAVTMFVVPLPAYVLDFLIALNMAASVVVLLVGLHVSDALRIAAFPSVLLLTTLFRLALEVSATRLILLKANAGQVIHAFGSFVAGGNVIVGIVVFVILTTVQFIVIAKGAARVAEVGARFTLDAMPGRQLAIDGDLRAGHIDAGEAVRLRGVLVRESQFFGAMDGAMKFVRGDALAGIVVLLTNLIGGLLIGIAIKGMDGTTALRTYALLTVGEGLVAQLPALILSIAAGIVVTRVSPEEQGAHLGSDIGRQIVAQPKATAIAAVLLGLLALVPGLPTVPFLGLAIVLAGLAYGLASRSSATLNDDGNVSLLSSLSQAPDEQPVPPLLVPLSIHLASDLDERDLRERLTSRLLPAVRERLFAQTGIVLPVTIVRADAALAKGSCVFCLHEIPVETARLSAHSADASLAPAIAEQWLRVLRNHAYRFVDVQQTHVLLGAVQRTHPQLVRAVVPDVVSVIVLAEILRRLAEEGISLRYLADILPALAAHAGSGRSVALRTEDARSALARPITAMVTRPSGSVGVYSLDPMIEDTLREAVATEASGGTHLALEPGLATDIVKAVSAAVSDVPSAVILTSRDIRRHLRDLLVSASLPVAVLAHQELTPEAKLETLGHITIQPEDNLNRKDARPIE